MDYFYFLYAFLTLYILRFFREILRTLKFTSYTTLYKTDSGDNKSFVIGILYIIISKSITPIIAMITTYMNFKSFQNIIIIHLSNAGYFINLKTIDWFNVILKNNSAIVLITNQELLDVITKDLFNFKIQTAIIILSALIVQAKVFDNNTLIIFEEGLMHESKFYTWNKIKSINIANEDTSTMDYSLSRFSKINFIHFEIETSKSLSRYEFFKSGGKVVPKEGLDETYKKIAFKLPDSRLLDFKSAIRMVNVSSNIK